MAAVIDESNFDELVLRSNQPAMVDFWAEWCGPCRVIAPYVEQIAAEYEGRAVVGKVDVDQCPGIAEKYSIRSIPTVLFFKGGEVVDKQVGVVARAALSGKLNALL
jgi:thioredoxin 1